MLELKDDFVLYHGSYCEVKKPDLAKCAKRKDFGQGFYLTTSKEQAESFLRTSIAKAIAIGTIEEGQQAIRRQMISASASCCPIN